MRSPSNSTGNVSCPSASVRRIPATPRRFEPLIDLRSLAPIRLASGSPLLHSRPDDLQQAEIVLPRDLELLGNQLPELAFGQQAGEESTALLIFKRFALQRQAQ